MGKKLKVNPFRPGKPITDPELFAGRHAELAILVDALYQTGNGNAKHVIITGARGVGKSSFANQIERLAKEDKALLKELDIDPGGFKFNFHICKHRATEGQSALEIVSSLLGQIPVRFSKDNVKDIFNDFVSRWKFDVSLGGVVGGEYQSNKTTDLSMDFVRTVQTFWKAVQNEIDGLIFLIDEVDTIADGDIASFCKVSTEALVDEGIEKVGIVLIGITGAMEKLKKQHLSVGRIFDTIWILPMYDEEVAEILRRALLKSKTIIEPEVVKRIVELSAGYPSPVHLLGYYAFDEDTDKLIDIIDLEKSINKVVTIVKREELDNAYKGVGSGDFRKILLSMANYQEELVPIQFISDTIGSGLESTTSIMINLQEKGMVENFDGEFYKISNPLLRVYIQRFNIINTK
jgi:Cdc6-like AAA superfamily ATPase